MKKGLYGRSFSHWWGWFNSNSSYGSVLDLAVSVGSTISSVASGKWPCIIHYHYKNTYCSILFICSSAHTIDSLLRSALYWDVPFAVYLTRVPVLRPLLCLSGTVRYCLTKQIACLNYQLRNSHFIWWGILTAWNVSWHPHSAIKLLFCLSKEVRIHSFPVWIHCLVQGPLPLQ